MASDQKREGEEIVSQTDRRLGAKSIPRLHGHSRRRYCDMIEALRALVVNSRVTNLADEKVSFEHNV